MKQIVVIVLLTSFITNASHSTLPNNLMEMGMHTVELGLQGVACCSACCLCVVATVYCCEGYGCISPTKNNKTTVAAPAMERDSEKDQKNRSEDFKAQCESFALLAGDIPQEVQRVIAYVKNEKIRERYKKFNVKPYKGILFHGPPGTGKTALARAIAHETQAPFLLFKSSGTLSKWLGESEQNIASLFQKAQEQSLQSPSKMAIIFIDELDGIAAKRTASINEKPSGIIQELLSQMDGFEANNGVLVIGATNKPDSLDDAIKRPGRFDVAIHFDFPDREKQKKILGLYLSQTCYEFNDSKEKEESVNNILAELQKDDKYISPALIREIVAEAARRAAHDISMRNVTHALIMKVIEDRPKKHQ